MLFDEVVISAEVGLHKPQPEIYRLAAERVGVPPEACLFVVDLRVRLTASPSVAAAGSAGISRGGRPA